MVESGELRVGSGEWRVKSAEWRVKSEEWFVLFLPVKNINRPRLND
jgi:hypothetical protein